MHAQRLADDLARRHARIERGERVLEDDLHLPPVGAQLRPAEARDVGTVELDAARGRLDQPQHGATDCRLAAARLADQPQRLARTDREADAVDREDMAGRAPQYALLDREMLLELPHLQDRRHGRRALRRCGGRPASAMPGSEEALRAPAGGPMAGPLFLVGRIVRAAAVVGESAARREHAAFGQVRQRRHDAGDLVEAAAAPSISPRIRPSRGIEASRPRV